MTWRRRGDIAAKAAAERAVRIKTWGVGTHCGVKGGLMRCRRRDL